MDEKNKRTEQSDKKDVAHDSNNFKGGVDELGEDWSMVIGPAQLPTWAWKYHQMYYR